MASGRSRATAWRLREEPTQWPAVPLTICLGNEVCVPRRLFCISVHGHHCDHTLQPNDEIYESMRPSPPHGELIIIIFKSSYTCEIQH